VAATNEKYTAIQRDARYEIGFLPPQLISPGTPPASIRRGAASLRLSATAASCGLREPTHPVVRENLPRHL